MLNNHRRHDKGVTLSRHNRRHFEEIVAMQDLAAAVALVAPSTRALAYRYRDAVARQLGVASDVDA